MHNLVVLHFSWSKIIKGVKPPFWVCDLFSRTIGYRQSELGIQIGTLYSPQQALKINLVDEICSPNELLPRAEQQMQKWLKIPSRSNSVCNKYTHTHTHE